MRKRYLLLILLLFIAIVTASDNSYSWVRPAELFNLPATAHFYIANETPVLVPIGDVNVYHNITPFQLSFNRNVAVFNQSYFNITYNGTYDLFWQLAFLDGANKEFETVVFVNDIEGHSCESNRKLGAGGDVGSHSARCYLNLVKGDEVNIRIKALTNPAPASITVQAAQFNINRITAAGTSSTTVLQNITINQTITINNTINQTINTTINQTLYIENGTYATVKRSDAISYLIGEASATDNVFIFRPCQNETVTSFIIQPSVPKNVMISAANLDFLNDMNGTTEVKGTDQDGKAISEIFIINIGPAGPILEFKGDRAFSKYSSVIYNKTGPSTNCIYAMGTNEKLGIPNYPFDATTDVFKVSKNSRDIASTGYTVNETYGTINFSSAIQVNDWYTIWYRPFR